MKNTKKNSHKSVEKSTPSGGVGVQYPPFSLNHLFLNGFIRDTGQLSVDTLKGIYDGIQSGIISWGYEWFNGRLVMVFYPNFI
jgi:hypothetical protein